jgi:ABC-type antimicrobial peptide transport system permease subunit
VVVELAEDWFDAVLFGLIVGVLVGIPLGWILSQSLSKPAPSSLVLDRDRETKLITGIHYLPVGVKAGG